MNSKKDPMGRAIADYWKTKKAERLRVFSPMFEEDEIPLQTLFRKYEDMPDIELKALDMAKGKTLDVGAGAGCHSLVLQEKGFDVTAIDISPLSVQAMKERGVKNVLEQDFFTLKGQYDTILMLMNGIGIVGTLERLPKFFRQLDNILAPGGQVLCDSSDISYVFEDENGMIDIPNEMDYYGEHSFRMQYKDTIGEPFDWLYIDADTLKENAAKNGYIAEIVAEGEHYDYLARITKMILLDTGASDVFIKNAEQLGIDLSDVDYVFISHGHSDHAGGFRYILEHNKQVKVIVSPDAMSGKFFSKRGNLHSITTEWPEIGDDRLILINQTFEITEGIHVIAHIPQKHPMPKGNQNLYVQDANGDYIHDDFRHELALYVDGLLFTGCAHSGLENIMSACPWHVHTVVGGFHLLDGQETDEELVALTQRLKANYPETRFYTSHCTGDNVFDVMKVVMGKQLQSFRCGTMIE